MKVNIRDVIAETQPHTLEQVYENWSDQIRHFKDSHMNERIVHFQPGTITSHSHSCQMYKTSNRQI